MRKILVTLMLMLVLASCGVEVPTEVHMAAPPPVPAKPVSLTRADWQVGQWYAAAHAADVKRFLDADHAAKVEAARKARAARAAAAARAQRSTVYAAAAPSELPAVDGAFPAILYRIRGCESGTGPNSPGSYTAKNPHSSASGAYQFLDGTWRSTTGLAPPARAYSPAQQDAAALKLYRSSGTSPWNASRYCWG